jgi:hypothetical protein
VGNTLKPLDVTKTTQKRTVFITSEMAEDAIAILRTFPFQRFDQWAAERCRCSFSLTRTVKKWQFPSERFVTYTPEDEPWCRFFGIGREVEVQESVEFDAANVTFCVEPQA